MNKGINVLSLFDGISCGQMALKRAGIRYDNYYASEIDTNAIKVTQSNFPQTKQLGDVTKIHGKDLPQIDLIIGGSPCFIAGTQILTINGYKPIEEININDFVLSHTGKWQKVLKIGYNDNMPTRIIKGYGNIGIETTDNHPFYIRNLKRKWNNQTKSSVRYFDSPEWVVAKELDSSKYCAMVQNKSNENELNYDFWYMIGRYTGDGWYRKTKRKNRLNSYINQFIICCGKHEFNELKNKFEKFGYKFNYSEERTAFKFRVCSQKLVDFVTPIKTGASNKVIHPLLFTESIENKKAFLDGLFDSDGEYRIKTGSYRLTTTSYILALGTQQIITDVYNRPVSFGFTKRNPKCLIEGRLVNQKNTYTIEFKKDNRKQDKAFNDGLYSWLPIKYNTLTNNVNRVYNLEVENDNSYTANNIVVHNCQGFSFSGKQLNFDDPRSKLFFEFVRLIKELKPKYWLLENVVMKKEFEATITEHLGVEPVLINSDLVSAQNRKRLYWANFKIEQPNDRGINLADVLENNDYPNKATILGRRLNAEGKRDDYNLGIPVTQCLEVRATNRNKSNCLTTVEKDNVLTTMPIGRHVDAFNRKLPFRYYTLKECCRLQTVSEDYFNGVVSDNQAKKMLGNGWTVEVIVEILSYLNF